MADEERVGVRPAVGKLQAAVERKSLGDRAHLDEADGPVLAAGRHGLRLDDVGPTGPRLRAEHRRERRPLGVGPRPGRLHHDVSADEHARLAGERDPDVLDHAPQHDDGGDAERDAQKEEHQPQPGGPRLAPRHAQEEQPGVHATIRPSLSAIVWLARPASAGSCVTSTSERARSRLTRISRSMTCAAGRAVEVAGRFVGEHDGRIVGERARNRDPLLLAPGQLRRVMVAAQGQARPRRGAPARAQGRPCDRRAPWARGCSRRP